MKIILYLTNLHAVVSVGVLEGTRAKVGDVKNWVSDHPGKSAAMAGSLLFPPFAAAAALPIIAVAGFTAQGVAAGSMAAAFQGGVGNVAAGSLFAVLQSAGAGGAGASLVSTSVWGGASAACWGAIAAALAKGSMEKKNDKDGMLKAK